MNHNHHHPFTSHFLTLWQDFLDLPFEKMTRQFCREKQGKNGHIFGKILQCVSYTKTQKIMTLLCLLFALVLVFENQA